MPVIALTAGMDSGLELTFCPSFGALSNCIGAISPCSITSACWRRLRRLEPVGILYSPHRQFAHQLHPNAHRSAVPLGPPLSCRNPACASRGTKGCTPMLGIPPPYVSCSQVNVKQLADLGVACKIEQSGPHVTCDGGFLTQFPAAITSLHCSKKMRLRSLRAAMNGLFPRQVAIREFGAGVRCLQHHFSGPQLKPKVNDATVWSIIEQS